VYTQVANLAYRNEDDFQVPLYHGLGTGRNFSDYDQTALRSASSAGGRAARAEVTLLRQGKGIRASRILCPRTIRRRRRCSRGGAAHGALRPRRPRARGAAALERQRRVHAVTNDGHVLGRSRTRFVGSVG
jgi:hypothetical protein